jgi:hypothetical protein
MSAFYFVLTGATLRQLPFPSPRFVVGSAADADLRLEGLAPHHAEVAVDPFDAVWVRALSPAGVLIKGLRVIEGALPVGEVLRLGVYELILHDEFSAFTDPINIVAAPPEDFDTRDEPPTVVDPPKVG